MAKPASSEIRRALRSFRGVIFVVALFSGVINILMLTGAVFMLEIYDRVLPSGSVPTLVALGLIAGFLFMCQAALDVIRSRLFVRIGGSLDNAVAARVYSAVLRMPLMRQSQGDGLQPVRDLDQIRSFVATGGPVALFDLPWVPFYVAICFAFHFWIGVTAAAGAAILLILTVTTEVLTRSPAREAAACASTRNGLAEASRRNAEAIQAMGMAARLATEWRKSHSSYVLAHQRANDVSGGFSALSKVFRIALQAAVLGVGAYLVIHNEATAGIIIAASILSARALAPVELAIANWRGLQAARQAWRRLEAVLADLPEAEEPTALAPPNSLLFVEAVSVRPPGCARSVIQDVSFELRRGSALGIIGPSASGKSSLARALVGVWPLDSGKIRLDGAALEQWSPEARGRHIGYLPQDVELLDGTVAQNIARFDPNPAPQDIIGAARAASVHELILRLPEGYETFVGESGAALSAGQRQRIALARALYQQPFLLVLDEPNSNLDPEGEEALTRAILSVRQRGGVVTVIAHRPSALAAVDLVMVIAEGRVQAFGSKEEILHRMRRPANVAVPEARA